MKILSTIIGVLLVFGGYVHLVIGYNFGLFTDVFLNAIIGSTSTNTKELVENGVPYDYVLVTFLLGFGFVFFLTRLGLKLTDDKHVLYFGIPLLIYFIPDSSIAEIIEQYFGAPLLGWIYYFGCLAIILYLLIQRLIVTGGINIFSRSSEVIARE